LNDKNNYIISQNEKLLKLLAFGKCVFSEHDVRLTGQLFQKYLNSIGTIEGNYNLFSFEE